eukprot:TRINITY_DN45762_c0_g1_i1.p1 TRINITY_DN45762_c0_g1~~TRINITY_DN45762_c0_g1_i1.p1  ORF type:complete len:389 (+),score=86.00 TRINITY_DN45762_c0_g1_i1:65-1168(+)
MGIVPLGLILLQAALAHGHGAMVNPLTRNAIDRSLPWSVRAPRQPCTCANTTAGSAGAHSEEGCDNAQACYWYQQGCSIGCPSCDSVNGRQQVDLCGLGKKATINDPELRTVNREAVAGSIYDIYKHNPWRAPGSAPTVDACGLAGGTPWTENVPEWGEYVNTTFAKHGDKGSKLPEVPTNVLWLVGGTAEVTWQITANHGGGYQYRLCPAAEELTEECFMKHPLEFDTTKQALQWNNGSRLAIQGTFVTEGVLPEGSMWAMNPIPPRCLGGGCKAGAECTPCPGTPGSDCTTCDNTPDPSFPPPCTEGSRTGLCSGNQPSSWGAVAVVDTVKIPDNLATGKYVLGWRMDCEATAQVWSNCADILIL